MLRLDRDSWLTELLQRYQQGDPDAARGLFDRYAQACQAAANCSIARTASGYRPLRRRHCPASIRRRGPSTWACPSRWKSKGNIDMGLTEAEVAKLLEEAKAMQPPEQWYI